MRLVVTLEKQVITVTEEQGLNTDPANNADAVVLKGQDLDVLPDDPDALASAVQAMAGPSAGPNGGQIFIDGFTGGRMPPKESIREVRINQNPFNAENNNIGFGQHRDFHEARRRQTSRQHVLQFWRREFELAQSFCADSRAVSGALFRRQPQWTSYERQVVVLFRFSATRY